MNYWVWNRVDGASDKEIGTLVPIKERIKTYVKN